MKEEIILHIYALTAYTSMDLVVAGDVTLQELCHTAAAMMEVCTHGNFQARKETRLIREVDGTWLLGSTRIKDIPILTGEMLYIL